MASKLMKSLTFVRVVFIGTLAIPELDSESLHNRLSDPGSDCGRLLGLTPATQRYKGRPCGIKTQEIAVFCVRDLYTTIIVALAILYSTADYSTTAGWILILFPGDSWARRQLSNGIRYVSVASKLSNLLSSVERIFIVLVALDIFYSTADYSTAAGPILIPFAGGCWARCRLPNGIRYVSVSLKLMNPPTLLRVVLLKVHELDGRSLHNRWADSGSDCGRLLGLMPATRWYKVRLCRIRTHGSTSPSESGLCTKVMKNSIADSSTCASPILDLIVGDCRPQRRLHNDIRSFLPRFLFMKLQC